jgi:UDP-N-acetylmuramyl pentapeptide phosphotransferase/UDP-N-acetylglucosamine-1-phosphate transferase
MREVFISFVTSFLITYFAIPSIIKVASIRKIFDEPNERKLHQATIPALGGVAIFSGMFFSILFWTEVADFLDLKWIVLSLVIIFLLGLKDDIVSIDPYKKLLGEIVAAGIVIFWGNIRITNLHGLFQLYELPYLGSVLLTLSVIIVTINAFNLIDGIDGLAGSLGVVASASFGTLFYLSDLMYVSLIAFSLTGALLAFLRYNFSPARIFMGDSGSLIVGFLLALLCVHALNIQLAIASPHWIVLPISAIPALVIAILIVPLTDTLRVFSLRLAKGHSPFKADRNHIHHVLLEMKFNHRTATLLLVAINSAIIGLTVVFAFAEIHLLLLLIVVAVGSCLYIGNLTYAKYSRTLVPENGTLENILLKETLKDQPTTNLYAEKTH